MASNPPPKPSRKKQGTLAALVGLATAAMLFSRTAPCRSYVWEP